MISRFCFSLKTSPGTRTVRCGFWTAAFTRPKKRLLICKTHREVAQAITDMVTQSYGPFHAAAMGMALAAHECRGQTAAEQRAYLKEAADAIAGARPTTSRKMRTWTDDCERDASAALDAGESAGEAILRGAIAKFSRRYDRIAREAKFFLEKIPKDATIMTQCYGDTDSACCCAR